MTVYDTDQIRNTVLVGHQGSGKTMLAENMLYASGALDRPGSIEEGSTVSDYHASEKERTMSIFTSLLHAEWNDHKINILDTPGYPDFSGEVTAAMTVADTAIYVMDAREGVEVGTELAWGQGISTQVPSMFVINHLDEADADFRTIIDQIQERFGRGATVVQIPAGAGSRSIIDVLLMKQLTYPEGATEPEVGPIDEAFRDEAEELHETLVEDIAENDVELMEAYFEAGELTEPQMRRGLRTAMVERELFPIFVTSATEHIGVDRLMDFITETCPSPAQRPIQTADGDPIEPDADGETVAFIYRTMAEQHVGEYSFVRVYSGAIEPGMDLANPMQETTERTGQLYVINGSDRENVPRVEAGDLAALVKLQNARTNDTLCEQGTRIIMPPIEFPEPRHRAAVETVQEGQEDKLARGLNQLTEEDPSLSFEHEPHLKQLTLSGQGEMHLQVAKDRLLERFGVEVAFSTPRIAYLETIQSSARASYRHKKQSGGAGQFGEMAIIVEPYDGEFHAPDDVKVRGEEVVETDWGAEVHFVNAIVGGVIDMRRFFAAIQKGVLDAMEEGPVAGFPVGDVRVVIYDGGMHPVDSNEAAFKACSFNVFRNAFREAKPALLEPIHEVTVTVPETYTGDVISDLNTRRARVQGIAAKGMLQEITAEVPEAELHRYSTTLRSITQGRGMYQSQFSHYQQMPRNVQDDVVEQAGAMEKA